MLPPRPNGQTLVIEAHDHSPFTIRPEPAYASHHPTCGRTPPTLSPSATARACVRFPPPHLRPNTTYLLTLSHSWSTRTRAPGAWALARPTVSSPLGQLLPIWAQGFLCQRARHDSRRGSVSRGVWRPNTPPMCWSRADRALAARWPRADYVLAVCLLRAPSGCRPHADGADHRKRSAESQQHPVHTRSVKSVEGTRCFQSQPVSRSRLRCRTPASQCAGAVGNMNESRHARDSR